jgi:fructose-1-phosphate kinase PfkB-like protein
MVKPNIHELSALLGAQPLTDSDIIDASRDLLGMVTGVVCVTRGSESVLCHTEAGSWRAAPPQIKFVSAVGSGDAFLAAFIFAVENGEPMTSALRMGVGAGAANAAIYGAGFCSQASMRELAVQTVVEAV